MTITASRVIEERCTSGAYSKRPLTIVRGKEATVWDDQGNTYIDLTSGLGVALLGHAHPAVNAAISQQAATLTVCPEMFYNDRRAEFYALLETILPDGLNRFFLCNSGAEAIEGALKIARLLTGRTGVVAVKRGFHGRTMGAVSLTWNPHYREPFTGWTMPEVTHVTFNDLDAAEVAINDHVAAVVVEVVQGEGGVYPASVEYLQGLRALCDEKGALLIIDEIQTGMGRTGHWFAFEHAAILPDIVALGKGIGGGIPLGVICWRGSLGTIPSGSHGSTFGGNPLACAAATASLYALQENGIPERSRVLGQWLLEQLRSLNHRHVRDIRGLGLMVGLELRGRVTPILQNLQKRGVLALPAGKNVLRLLPPLIISQDTLEIALDAIDGALDDTVSG